MMWYSTHSSSRRNRNCWSEEWKVWRMMWYSTHSSSWRNRNCWPVEWRVWRMMWYSTRSSSWRNRYCWSEEWKVWRMMWYWTRSSSWRNRNFHLKIYNYDGNFCSSVLWILKWENHRLRDKVSVWFFYRSEKMENLSCGSKNVRFNLFRVCNSWQSSEVI